MPLGVLGLGTVVGSSARAGAASDSSPIVIGGQGDLSTAPGVAQGFEARIHAFNNSGGLDGRKIHFLGMLDDAESSQTNLTNSQKLVESDHVMAVAPYISTTCSASGTGFLEQNKTPFVGWAVCAGWIGNNYGIGINGAQVNIALQSETGMLQAVAAMKQIPSLHVTKASDVKIAVMGYDTVGGSVATKTLTAAAKAVGMQVVYSNAPNSCRRHRLHSICADDHELWRQPRVPDHRCSPGRGPLERSQDRGVQGIPDQRSHLLSRTAQLQSAEAAALDTVGVENEFPVNEDKTPAVELAEARLRAINQSPYLTSGTSIGYWSADVLIQLLEATAKRVGVSNLSGAALQQTAANGWTYTGGLGVMSYPAAWTYPTGCGTLVQQVGTSYKLLAPYVCTKLYAKTGI